MMEAVDSKVEIMVKKKEMLDHLFLEQMIRENLKKQLHQEKLEESKKSDKSLLRA